MEIDYNGQHHSQAIDRYLRALLPSFSGIRDAADGRWWIILDDKASDPDIAVAKNTADSHDPVFLSADKTALKADGKDAVTIRVYAPKKGAAGVVLSVSGQDLPIALDNAGNGADTIASLDPATITISLKDSANRSTDILTIIAR